MKKYGIVFGQKGLLCTLVLFLALFARTAIADTLCFPEKLFQIGAESFYGNHSIDKVILPDGIRRIENKAFLHSSLSEIYLPASLSYIAADAFDEDVVVYADRGTYAFEWALQNGYMTPPKAQDQLDYPVIVMEDSYDAGTDVSFSVLRDSNAEDYYFNLFVDNTQIYWDFHIWDPLSYTFKGYDLQPGNYVLVVTSSSTDLTENSATKHFRVVGDKREAPTVQVDKLEVTEGEEYTFLLNTSGAERALVREYSFGAYSEDIRVVDSEMMQLVYRGSSRKRSYQFCLMVNGYWTEFSEKITIAPKTESGSTNGQLEEPDVSINATYQSGKDVTFSVSRDPDAEDYYFNLYNDDEQLYWDFHFWSPFSYTFRGYDLQPGNYTLIVTATADGLEPHSSCVYFVVLGEKLTAPSVSVDKTEVHIDEEYTFTVSTIGAEKVLAREYSTGSYSDSTYDVDSTTKQFTYCGKSRKRSYQFCLMVNGCWTEFSERITITPIVSE